MAEVRREGDDVTVVAIAKMVNVALAAAEALEAEGISVEVIDPRTLSPLDGGKNYSGLGGEKRGVW